MTSHLRLSLPAALFAALALAGQTAMAGHRHGAACDVPGCVDCAPPQVVTQTVMVPQTTYKTITVQGLACKPELRQATIMACRLVPETTMVNCLKTVMEPQRRTWTESYTACRMTFETAQQQVTVMVPHRELRQGVRTVCKPVATQVMQTVCKDLGQWTTKSYVDTCGCPQTCQVWLPNIVTEQVPVTVWKPHFVEEPFQYDEIVCKPEVRNVTVQIPKPIYETKTREVSCVVPVCKQVEAQVPRTTYRKVTEPKVVNYTAMVQVPVTRQVQVPVCTLVPKTVACLVPAGCR
jgi:hypothetical protein